MPLLLLLLPTTPASVKPVESRTLERLKLRLCTSDGAVPNFLARLLAVRGAEAEPGWAWAFQVWDLGPPGGLRTGCAVTCGRDILRHTTRSQDSQDLTSTVSEELG